MLTVPRRWSEISPEWMTGALARRYPGVSVLGVAVEDAVDGTNRRARVRLSYAPGSSPEVPRSVFVKREGRVAHRLALVALRALTTEARLARSGELLPIEHPATYDAGIDLARLAAIVVMDDVVSQGARPNLATTPLTVDEVRDGLSGLASLHGRFWDRPLPPSLGFLRHWRLGAAWAAVSAASLARGFRRLKHAAPGLRIPAGVTPLSLERQFRRSATLAASGPQTLLHGDPHPGNTYALDGGRTGFYDWQLARVGNWSHDVGYFMVSCLSTADRRSYERELLGHYLRSLGALEQVGGSVVGGSVVGGSVVPPTFEAAWDRYRATPAFGLGTWVHTVSAGSFQPVDVCVSTIERFAAAYEDLDTGHSMVTS